MLRVEELRVESRKRGLGIHHPLGEVVAFSLTPALSRWERENGLQPHCHPAHLTRRTLADFLPLLGGEGRGEGEPPQNYIV